MSQVTQVNQPLHEANASDNVSDELRQAVARRDSSQVQRLLDKGASPDTMYNDHIPILAAAVTNRDTRTAEILLGAGAHVNRSFRARMTSSTKPDVLHLAIEFADVATIDVLLSHGADPRLVDSSQLNAAHKMLENADEFLVIQNGEATLTRVLQRMLDQGIPLDQTDSHQRTLLHCAVKYARVPKLIDLLLKRGADVDARDSNRMTPLHHAVALDCESAASALLDHGAAVDAKSQIGHPPLMFAQSPAMARLLVDRGANINSRDWNGMTILAHALRTGFPDVVSPVAAFLIDAGADVDLPDYRGENSARSIINERNMVQAAALIDACQAREAINAAGKRFRPDLLSSR